MRRDFARYRPRSIDKSSFELFAAFFHTTEGRPATSWVEGGHTLVCFANVDRPREAIERRCDRRSRHQPAAIVFTSSREPRIRFFETDGRLPRVISDETQSPAAGRAAAEVTKLARHLCLLSPSPATCYVVRLVKVAGQCPEPNCSRVVVPDPAASDCCS